MTLAKVSPVPAALIIGARNLGFAIIERLLADGWDVCAGARSPETLEKVRAAGADALELREHRIQVSLLIVDAMIDRSAGDGADSADPASLAAAVAYLAAQSPRAMTHELQVTPALDNWTPS